MTPFDGTYPPRSNRPITEDELHHTWAALEWDLGDRWPQRATAHTHSGLFDAAFSENRVELRRIYRPDPIEAVTAAAVLAWATTRAVYTLGATPTFMHSVGRIITPPEHLATPDAVTQWRTALDQIIANTCRSQHPPHLRRILDHAEQHTLGVEDLIIGFVTYADATTDDLIALHKQYETPATTPQADAVRGRLWGRGL